MEERSRNGAVSGSRPEEHSDEADESRPPAHGDGAKRGEAEGSDLLAGEEPDGV